MKKLIMVAALALCGCDFEPQDIWKYEAAVPLGTNTQELMQIESTLRSNGYVRVRFITHYGWAAPVGMSVHATRKEKR